MRDASSVTVQYSAKQHNTHRRAGPHREVLPRRVRCQLVPGGAACLADRHRHPAFHAEAQGRARLGAAPQVQRPHSAAAADYEQQRRAVPAAPRAVGGSEPHRRHRLWQRDPDALLRRLRALQGQHLAGAGAEGGPGGAAAVQRVKAGRRRQGRAARHRERQLGGA